MGPALEEAAPPYDANGVLEALPASGTLRTVASEPARPGCGRFYLAETAGHLPIGIQFGTRHAEEGRLLALAYSLKQALPWQDRVPPIHVLRG